MSCSQDAGHGIEDEAVTHRIVTSIAEQTGTDPLDLPPLTQTVDVDALATVVRSDAVSEITFSYDGYEVVIEGDGNVRVTEHATEA